MNITRHTVAVFALAAALGASAQDQRGIVYGTAANANQAERVIAVTPDAKWVNVKQGETVKFTLGSVEFSWRFDGRSARSFDLREIAPAGAVNKAVMVYITQTGGHRSN